MSFKGLIIYQKAYQLAMKIFEISKYFPKDERYSLIDQIRRSSRSVCANLAEGYRKRKYKAHFIAKLSDVDMENSETQVWLDFALSCGYIKEDTHKELLDESEEVGKLLHHMMEHPDKYIKLN